MTEAVYKGLSALVLENEILRLTFLPGYGFKLASLLSKKTGREWLFQSPENTLRIPEYGAPFSAYDSSGFDEVFPSIDACPYPDGPYKGLPVPDHGELWTLPWEGIASPDGKSVKAFTESKVFPYIFSRRTTLNKNEIIFEYEVENTSYEEFKFIWTPHCLLACSPATRLIVPENLTQVMTVEHSTQHLGVWGTRHSYPITTDIHGQTIDLSATEPASACNCEKFYFTALNLAGWCAIEHTDTGETLRYDYDGKKIPYLGIWKTQGGYRGDYNIALEPCTGEFDDLYVANKLRRTAVIEPKDKFVWKLKMTVL